MNAVAANRIGRSSVGASRPMRAAVAPMLLLPALIAGAQEEVPPASFASSASAAHERTRPMQMAVSASSLPRFDNIDGSSRNSRIDLSWLPPRRSALGLSLGMTSMDGPGLSAGGSYPGTASNVDLGFHWRYTLDSQYRIDVKAWRRMAPSDAVDLVQARQPTYGARVEMQLGSMPQRGFVADRGFLGLQLEGGARITVRRSGGRPMLYYRTRF